MASGSRNSLRRQDAVRRKGRHPDAGDAVPAHSRRYGECRDLAVSGPLQGRAGASPRRVVCERAEGLLDEFLAAAEELVRLGADGITTTCGFLSLYQRDIAAHVGVPVGRRA